MDEARQPQASLPASARAPELELQFEQVNVALNQLRQTHDKLHDMESRLAHMTTECADILDRWARNDERHSAAVIELHGRLSEWNDLERKLLNESATRIHQFERSLQHEWQALRQKHEEPIQRLHDQAERITGTCLNAIGSALKGFDKAEARLANIEQHLYREMGDLSREVREAVAELREGAQRGPKRPWALDNVVRLHNELRAEADDTGEVLISDAATVPDAVIAAAQVPDGAGIASGARGRVEDSAGSSETEDAPGALHRSGGLYSRDARPEPVVSPAHVSASPAASDRPAILTRTSTPTLRPDPVHAHATAAYAVNDWGVTERRPSWWRQTPVIVGAAAVAALAATVVYMRVDARLTDAASRTAAAERSIAQSRDAAQAEIDAARRAAEARIASAQQTAQAAQLLASILAAPDLRRFDLSGRTRAAGASGQMLWSRSQGVSLTLANLPKLDDGTHYQAWLDAPSGPRSLGIVDPDVRGHVTLAAPAGPAVPNALVGLRVTIEPGTGAAQPSGNPVVVSTPRTPRPMAAPATLPAAAQ
jgi:hypothetical protein